MSNISFCFSSTNECESNIFDSVFNDEYYLSKIKLNSAMLSSNVTIDDSILSWYTTEDINNTYNFVADIINKIIDKDNFHKVKKVIR